MPVGARGGAVQGGVACRGLVAHHDDEPLPLVGHLDLDRLGRAVAAAGARRPAGRRAHGPRPPPRGAAAVATSRAVRTWAGSGVKVTSTVAIGGRVLAGVTSRASWPRWPRPPSRGCRTTFSGRGSWKACGR